MAPSKAPIIIAVRASRFEPSSTAVSSPLKTQRSPSTAIPSQMGWNVDDRKLSTQCVRASIPVAAVSGEVIVGQPARMRDEQPDGLGRVDRTPATEPDQAVAPRLAISGQA